MCVQQTGTNKLNTMSSRRNFVVPFQLNLDAAVWAAPVSRRQFVGLAEEKTELLQLTPSFPVFLPFQSYSPVRESFRLDFEKLISEESSENRHSDGRVNKQVDNR